ncbi:ABC transporter ATP-binding protein [Teichococcus vastitatis]|uniref:ABC transporter ATP-binding protein n=1 Tax=Teichococcus vastitatis TaxID=2307076 RepID=A0ABS9W111_9PROT|nr:ABC transporter ATP-binding protein [Pseudoroseomonas vastitatis]MCI0752982.1 ABC transporter ATP-binding protein [Pseudoroseomonas vastitatis]
MIRFEGVSRRYGEQAAVDRVTLEVPRGSICVLLGESGSGKSTLMRMVNRLVEPSAGRVLVDGRDVAGADPEELRRGIGYVIQSVGLFPHWRVADNIATVPRLLGWEPARIAARVETLLELVGLEATLFRDRFPHELSGGQAQRVGLARALAADPPLLLMDEPFSALDPGTRRGLQVALREIHAETGKTILFVTHDVEEALALADRLAVLDQGQLVAQGRPAALLEGAAQGPVRRIFGEESLAFHRLATLPARSLARVGDADALPMLPADATLKQALMLMLSENSARLALPAEAGFGGGTLHWTDLVTAR